MFSHIIDLFSLFFQLSILAAVLCVVGFQFNKVITKMQESRRASTMNQEALVASAKARAAARRNARAA